MSPGLERAAAEIARRHGGTSHVLDDGAAALGGAWRTELAPAAVWSRAGADSLAARQRLFDRFGGAADPEGLFNLMAR